MNLYLIRHAEPDYENDTITKNGEIQAEKLADWLKTIKVDELYHSSMGRAGKTASYLSKVWKVEPVAIDWAREIRWNNNSKGNVDDSSPWAVKQRIIDNEGYYPEGSSWTNNPSSKDPDLIASYNEHCANLDSFLSEHGYVREKQLYKAVSPNEKTVVIVCHGGVISTWISHLANIPFYQFISHMGSDLTAVTKIQLRGEKDKSDAAQLVYVNSQAHLGVV